MDITALYAVESTTSLFLNISLVGKNIEFRVNVNGKIKLFTYQIIDVNGGVLFISIPSLAVGNYPYKIYDTVAPIPCWSLFTEGHVMSDGRITGCCADATGEWVMGTLANTSFMDIWHSEEFKILRKKHLDKDIVGTKCECCAMYK